MGFTLQTDTGWTKAERNLNEKIIFLVWTIGLEITVYIYSHETPDKNILMQFKFS